MIRTVIWDFNGTLLDDVEENLAVLNKMTEKRGLERVSKEKYLEYFSFPLIDVYRRFGFDFTAESYESVANEYIELYSGLAEGMGLSEGAREVLGYFKEQGCFQAIVSASPENMLIKQLKHLGIYEYFDSVNGMTDHYAYGKTEIAKAFMERCGIDRASAVYIGDTVHDAETASAMGVECILAAIGHCSFERLSNTGFPVIRSLKDVIIFLDGIK